MPYEIYRQGSKYCVRNKETGESKGCSSSKAMAVKHMRALYAAEGGAKMGKKETDQIENVEATEEAVVEKGYVPYGVLSFADLDTAREAMEQAEETYDLMRDFTQLVENIMTSEEVSDKAAAVKSLSDEFATRVSQSGDESEDKEITEEDDSEDRLIERIAQRFKEIFAPLFRKDENKDDAKEDTGNFMVWKEASGEMHFLARYSNNIRDDDHPAEIIKSDSHKRFVELVDKKEVSAPELWIWHVPEWKLGQSTWVAYDDVGFALAAGVIDKGKEEIAEQVSRQKGVLMSHGMPSDSIKRDPDDDSVIVEHTTKEISILPSWAAANKFTGFMVMDIAKEVDEMSIPQNKIEALVREWGGNTEANLKKLEEFNKSESEKAAGEGRETKEVTEEVVTTEVVAETTTTETTQETTPDYPTREEIAEAIANVVAPQIIAQNEAIAALSEEISSLRKELSELSKDDQEKIKAVVDTTPAASLGALIARQMSAVGSKDAEVSKKDSLLKSKPAEAEANPITGVQWIDEMISASRSQ